MPSPPKPREDNSTAEPTDQTTTTTTTTNPPLPDRSTMNTMNRLDVYGANGYGTTGYHTGYGGYGTTGYGSAIGYGGYGSTGYGRYGGYGTAGYGGYGTAGYGGTASHYNRFGPRYDDGLTHRMEQGTRPAFELIQSIVGAFGGFAHMLESTFIATHSSFMAMIGMAEQLGYLKSYLGKTFRLFSLYRFIKNIIGQPTITLDEFKQFDQPPPAPSRKPLLIFLAMIVGIPYLMHKLIQCVSANQSQLAQEIDPSTLEFARATYDFTAESPLELGFKKGDIVAILAKTDPITNASSPWWRGRLRDGTMGLFPANYVEIVQKGQPSS
ncbi:Peroxin 13, N-terminal region-domain-containing protein [Chlamydoabsidia padenii]|nr:Peroxin 13, N-terminal region-domain-containing protein [Chlamydoabsidia padenii]